MIRQFVSPQIYDFVNDLFLYLKMQVKSMYVKHVFMSCVMNLSYFIT